MNFAVSSFFKLYIRDLIRLNKIRLGDIAMWQMFFSEICVTLYKTIIIHKSTS